MLVCETLYDFRRTRSARATLGLGLDEQIKRFIRSTGYRIQGLYAVNNTPYKKPLWICASRGMVQFVDYLLLNGADPKADDSAALRWAAGRGYEEIVKMLLDAGANPGAAGTLNGGELYRFGGEAYAWAMREDYQNIINILEQAERGVKFFGDKYTGGENIVKESLQLFNKSRSARSTLGIPSTKEIIDKKISSLMGTASEEEIRDLISKLSTAYEYPLYHLYRRDREKLYWVYNLLGKDRVLILVLDLKDYCLEHKKTRCYFEDEAIEAYQEKVVPYLYNAWDVLASTSQGSYLVYVLVKYDK